MMKFVYALLLPALLLGCAGRRFQKLPEMSGKIYALRLQPGQDLKQALVAFTKEKNLEAAYLITCVGSVRQASLRLANQPGPTTWEGKFEIVSLVGTLGQDGVHLHAAFADSTGTTIGGHLVDGNLIYTTAEIVIGEASHLRFSRRPDPVTTYQELFIEERTQE